MPSFLDGGGDSNPPHGVTPDFNQRIDAPVSGISTVPTIVDINQAFVLTIHGSEFFGNAYHPTFVKVGTVSVPVTSYTLTEIVATYPAGIASIGAKAVEITYSDGDLELIQQTVTINALPVVSSISTIPDPVTDLTTFSISVHGTGFHTPAGRIVNQVKVGVTAGLITFQNGTIATASFAGGLAAGSYPVTIRFTNGTELSAGTLVIATSGPTITNVIDDALDLPANQLHANGQATIHGTGFVTLGKVVDQITINGVARGINGGLTTDTTLHIFNGAVAPSSPLVIHWTDLTTTTLNGVSII